MCLLRIAARWVPTPFTDPPPLIPNCFLVTHLFRFDPIAQRVIDPSEGRDVFVLALRGFNFGPPRVDGRGPLVLPGTGSSKAFSTVVVRTNLQSVFGEEVGRVEGPVCVFVCGGIRVG